MMNRQELVPCYILHKRAYSETRLIVDVLTEQQGKVSLLVRRPSKKSGIVLNPFQRLLVSWLGRSALKTATDIEAVSAPFALKSEALYCGLYVNELLSRVLMDGELCDDILTLYESCLSELQEIQNTQPLHGVERKSLCYEPVLRVFEFELLEGLGYAVNCDTDAVTDKKITAAQMYTFSANSGFVHIDLGWQGYNFSGQSIHAIQRRDFSSDEALRAAKVITRESLKPLLGSKPLKSRELFR